MQRSCELFVHMAQGPRIIDLEIWSISSSCLSLWNAPGIPGTWRKKWEKTGRGHPFSPSLTDWDRAILLEGACWQSVGLGLLLLCLAERKSSWKRSRARNFCRSSLKRVKANDLQGSNPFTLVNMQQIYKKERPKAGPFLLLQQLGYLEAADWLIGAPGVSAGRETT